MAIINAIIYQQWQNENMCNIESGMKMAYGQSEKK